MIPDASKDGLRVAILAHSQVQRDCLQAILEANGLQVVDHKLFKNAIRLDHTVADVLVFNMDESLEDNLAGDGLTEDEMERVLDQASVPILYNDGAATRDLSTPGGRAWGRRFTDKVIELANAEPEPHGEREPERPRPNLQLINSQPVASFDEEDKIEDLGVGAQVSEGSEDTANQHESWLVEEEDLEIEFSDPAAQPDPAPAVDPAERAANYWTSPVDYDDALAQDLLRIADAEQFDGLISEDEPEYDLSQFLVADSEGAGPASPSDVEAFESDGLAAEFAEALEDTTASEAAALQSSSTSEEIALISTPQRHPEEPREVWVLGASIGGPQAVKAFLALLPADLPVAFVLAQHIGSGFVNLLAEQLGRATPIKVSSEFESQRLAAGQLVVAPVESRLTFDEEGRIQFTPLVQPSVYSPSIDDVMMQVAQRFGADTRAIIFSGMGNDGVRGAEYVASRGGLVWAQEPDSCVISSMADCARETGVVEYSGTPESLAHRLVARIERERS